MARPYRLQGENCLYHITSRGDDRKKIFISETDHRKFLEYLHNSKEKFKFYLYAYCLMSNHYHLLLETTQANISRIMQYINTSYTVYYNVKRKRCGHLFQGRYKSILVEADSYLLELTRYIHLNPVRAKIVDAPEKYKWSSYLEYIKKQKSGFIDKVQVERYFRISSDKYKRFISEGITHNENPFKGVYAGFILGQTRFIKDTLNILKRRIGSEDLTHRKEIYGIEPEIIIQGVAEYYREEPEVLFKAKKKRLLAKKVAVYLLKRMTSLTNKEIGDKFGISYSGVSWAVRNIDKLIAEDSKIKNSIDIVISHLKV